MKDNRQKCDKTIIMSVLRRQVTERRLNLLRAIPMGYTV